MQIHTVFPILTKLGGKLRLSTCVLLRSMFILYVYRVYRLSRRNANYFSDCLFSSAMKISRGQIGPSAPGEPDSPDQETSLFK